MTKLLLAFERICEAVAFAHQQGIIHRDLKPDNIMLGQHGSVVVMDWGLAKLLPRTEHQFPMSKAIAPTPGSIVGTPAYMSPEQALGDGLHVDEQSDVYSLGCILYEILTGKAPRKGSSQSILDDIQSGIPLPALFENGKIPELIEPIYSKAGASQKVERYRDAGELKKALEDWLQGNEKRKAAMRLVEQSKTMISEYQSLLEEIDNEERKIRIVQREIKKWSPIAEKKKTRSELELYIFCQLFFYHN